MGPGERGEICLRGPNIMKGYWNRPDATAAAIDKEGWFHSGDVGYVDEDGFLYICDRLKDMVISGGENVYPAEVEAVIHDCPGVANVAVIGVPDARWGEVGRAFVEARPGSQVRSDEVSAFLEGRLARYKRPKQVVVMAALPRTASGKIDKQQLRNLA